MLFDAVFLCTSEPLCRGFSRCLVFVTQLECVLFFLFCALKGLTRRLLKSDKPKNLSFLPFSGKNTERACILRLMNTNGGVVVVSCSSFSPENQEYGRKNLLKVVFTGFV